MGDLVVPAQTTPAWGDLAGRNQPAVSLRAGRAWFLAAILNHTTKGQMMIGFWPTSTLDNDPNCAILTSESGYLQVQRAINITGRLNDYDTGTDYPVAIAWALAGYQVFSKRNGFWYRDWIYYEMENSNYGGFSNYDSEGFLKEQFMLRDKNASLVAPLVEVESPAVGTGSISGEEAPHSSFEYYLDFVVDTLPSSGNIRIVSHFQDADNYLFFSIDSDGFVYQGECQDGVETVIHSSVGIDIVFEGSRVTILVAFDVITVWRDITPLMGGYTPIEPHYYDMSPAIRGATDWEIGDLGEGGAISDLHFYAYCLREVNGLGADLVVNGDFATASDWTGADWDISGGNADHSAVPASTDALVADAAPLEEGKIYYCQMTASGVTAGNAQLQLGAETTPLQNNGGAVAFSNGAKDGYGIADGGDNLYIVPDDGFDGVIDDVSVQEVLFKNSELANVLDSLLS